MPRRKLVGLFAVVVLALFPKTSVVASNAELSEIRAVEDRETRPNGQFVFTEIQWAFPVPISFEWARFSPTSVDPFAVDAYVPFTVKSGETLLTVLERLEEALEQRYTWRVIANQICIVGQAGGRTCLDETISLDVSDMSLWNALVEVRNAVNRSASAAYPMHLIPYGMLVCRAPHPVFLKEGVVTLKVDDVTAREVVCEILAQSPVPTAYSLLPGADYEELTVAPYEDGRAFRGEVMSGGEELQFWLKGTDYRSERLTLRPDAEDAWLLEGAIYEVDLKYFENHHYDDLAARLPRLKELGVKVIYLLPVFESAGHGEYNIYDYYKLDPYFGTAEDLKDLVKKAHAHGIKVLLDLVTSITPEGSKVYEHQDWLLRGDDGKIQRYYPFPDWGWAPDPTHPEVIDYFAKVTSYYVKEFDIDGWRIDSPTDHFDPRKVSGDHSRVKLLRAAKAACVAVKPDAIFVAESPSPDQSFFPISREANPAFDEMCEASYNYPFCEFLAGTEESGFRLDMIPGYAGKEKEIEETFFYRVVEGKVSSKEFAAAVNGQKVLFDAYRANFLETHDTGRIAERYPRQHPALFAMLATMPGVPVIHAGQEIGATTPSAHAGTDARPVIDWANGDKEVEAVYRRLMRLRSESKAIQYGVLENVWFGGDPILAYTRRYEDDLVLVVLHFGADTAEATVAVTAGGSASSLTLADCIADTELETGAEGNLELQLPPNGWRVYRATASAG